jgi:hypothetical protein
MLQVRSSTFSRARTPAYCNVPSLLCRCESVAVASEGDFRHSAPALVKLPLILGLHRMQLSLLESLPDEVLRHVLRHCSLSTLLSLSATNRTLHEIISHDYLATFARTRLNYDPRTLKHIGFHARAPWAQRALWAERTNRRWNDWDGRGVAVGGVRREWRRCLPTLKFWEVQDGVEVVIVGRGRDLEVWLTRSDGSLDIVSVIVRAPVKRSSIRSTCNGKESPSSHHHGAQEDVTALASGTRPGEIIVSRVSGLIQRLCVVEHATGPGHPLVLEETARYSIPDSTANGRRNRSTVQAIHSRRDVLVSSSTVRKPASVPATEQSMVVDPRGPLVSLARTLKERSAAQAHSVSVHSIVAPWQPPVSIPFTTKPWSVHMSPQRSWLAVGHSGTAPLSLFQLDSTGAPSSSTPTRVAHTPKSTSVYGLTTPSEACSPFSNPEQTLIAAFYDSTTRVYDLRIPPSPHLASSWDAPSTRERPANEVLRLADPWSDDPSYSVGIGGAHGAYIAVGTARNAAVRLFDIRSPARPRGVTAFAPGRDRSPVYSLEVEGSRVWGCTENRGFLLDFEAFEAPRRHADKVAYVGHQEGEGGVLKWMGAR